MVMMLRCGKRIEDTGLSCLGSYVMVIGRVGIKIALHVGAQAWEGGRTELQSSCFGVESMLKLLEAARKAVAAQGIDSLVLKLASIRGRVHIGGLGSGQEPCIRSSLVRCRGWSGDVMLSQRLAAPLQHFAAEQRALIRRRQHRAGRERRDDGG